jgi:hypothetical protein
VVVKDKDRGDLGIRSLIAKNKAMIFNGFRGSLFLVMSYGRR